MNTEVIKKSVYFLGKSLGLLGLVYVFYKLWHEYTLSTFTEHFILLLDMLPWLFILNFVSILIGIYAWRIMLMQYSKKHVEYLIAYYYFSKTEIAKYLPGNIFHFVGRQVLASKIGISQVEMAKISLLHSLLLLTSTVFASMIFAFLSQNTPNTILILMGLSVIVIIIALVYIYPSFPMSKKISMNIYLAVSMIFQGIMLGLIVMYQSDDFTMSLFFICISIYMLSWLIGFATPGASGGLGVREGAFIAIVTYLNMDIASDIIIFSVLLIRIINIFIDIMMYLSTYLIKNKIRG